MHNRTLHLSVEYIITANMFRYFERFCSPFAGENRLFELVFIKIPRSNDPIMLAESLIRYLCIVSARHVHTEHGMKILKTRTLLDPTPVSLGGFITLRLSW